MPAAARLTLFDRERSHAFRERRIVGVGEQVERLGKVEAEYAHDGLAVHGVASAGKVDCEVAAAHGLEVLGRIPIDPKLAAACDRGLIEAFEGDWLDNAADKVAAL